MWVGGIAGREEDIGGVDAAHELLEHAAVRAAATCAFRPLSPFHVFLDCRLEAAKAKAEARAKAAAEGMPLPAMGPRIVSKHIAVPVRASAHATPQSSPRPGFVTDSPRFAPPPPYHAAGTSGGSAAPLEVPSVWQGYQSAESPADCASCTRDQLARFLLQAGWAGGSPEAVGLLSQEEMVAAAREARHQWEVERIMLACEWPEQVLRVPRGCTDPTVLRAAWRRVSMAVHPDKSRAEGASDAMSIVVDCFQARQARGRAWASTMLLHCLT